MAIDNPEIADVEVKNDENGRAVKVTAKATGVAKVMLSHEGAAPIMATVSVTDAKGEEPEVKIPEKAPEVEGLSETPEAAAGMADEAVEAELAKLDSASDFTEEHKEELKKQTAEMLLNLNATLKNEEIAKPAWNGDFSKDLEQFGLKPGQTAELGLKQIFDMEQSELKVELNEAGEPVSYFTRLHFDVTPMVEIFNGDTAIDKQEFAPDTELSGEVTFTLPIPDASAEKFAYSKVEHEHKGTKEVRWTSRKGSKGTWHVRVSSKKFSPFTLVFTDEAEPSNGGSGWVKPAGGQLQHRSQCECQGRQIRPVAAERKGLVVPLHRRYLSGERVDRA